MGKNNVQIDWPPWESMINERFVPLVENTDRYLILYGGRGSSKSNAVAKILIYRCLTEPYFRFILTRKYYTTIRNSQYKNLKDLIETLGLSKLFKFRTQPYEIECINGNMFVSAGCDEPQKIKSIKDPSGVWYEEDIIDEESWITITTSIRTTKANYLQEIFTINPEVEGDYRENWFFKRFFQKWWSPQNLNHIGMMKVDFGNRTVNMTYTVHHSDHTDNVWLPDEFRAFLAKMRIDNPYYYEIYSKGVWGNKVVGGRFYHEFDRKRHTAVLSRRPYPQYGGYNPERSLHISYDFNVRPYMTMIIAQIIGTKIYIIDEIAAKEPHNSTPAITRMFANKYQNQKARVYVYGDPAGRAESTRNEQDNNEYAIIKRILATFSPQVRVDRKAPSVELRGQFINEVFKNNFSGLSITIDEKCTNLIDDMMYLLEASDGTKHKHRVKDKESGVTYEQRGHFSDALDYFVCKAFKAEWRAYKRGDKYATGFQYIVEKQPLFSREFFT